MDQLTPEKLLWIIGMAGAMLVARTLYANRAALQTWLAGDRPLFHVLIGYHDVLSSDDDEDDLKNGVSNGSDGSTKGDTGFDTGAMTQATQGIDTTQLDVIIFDVLVERTAKAYDAKLFDSLTKAIEVNFDCSRQPESRDKSLYQRALKAVRAQSERYHAETQQQPSVQVGTNGDPIVEWITDGARSIPIREDRHGQRYVLDGVQRRPLDLYVSDMKTMEAA
ncbi:MAG TPA: hypothetical protein VFT66_15550 [Roseiflexaceae bacterium]|nr:hypothetical protein [Roseiflexaceae bacterium]